MRWIKLVAILSLWVFFFGIVALARKVLIALWRYATAGVLPAGAVLKGV